MLGRLSSWLQRTMAADERYICGACDDRFAGRGEGVAHVVRCHPEFAAGLVGIASPLPGWTQVAEPCPARTVVATTRPLMPAAG